MFDPIMLLGTRIFWPCSGSHSLFHIKGQNKLKTSTDQSSTEQSSINVRTPISAMHHFWLFLFCWTWLIFRSLSMNNDFSLFSRSVCQKFSYSSASFIDNGTCDKSSLFAVSEVKLSSAPWKQIISQPIAGPSIVPPSHLPRAAGRPGWLGDRPKKT